MLTGELRSKIDNVWNAFWAGGIANPIEVIEQITYLLFIRGLDDVHTLEERKATRLNRPMEREIFPKGKDGIGKDGGIAYEEMRWSRLKNKDPATMFAIVSEHVFPFLRSMAEEGTAHATHMKGARFTIPTPALLAKVVDLLADIPMDDRDTKGDLYEYMLGKIASAGQNGQFRTPRHIIALMVEMMAPTPKDVICDPACGTCGFLVAAGEYLRDNHPKLFHDKASRDHFNEEMFHGFDFDGTMLRIGSMNMTLHGVEDPDIRYKDSLSQEHAGDADRYSLVLAKTRTVIALVDLLMRAGWVKRVLFLADRVALVNQAAGAFKAHLPDSAPINLVTERTSEGRVFISTYPTMMGLIDGKQDGKAKFGPGHFDLIVIDEAHRSVYQRYRAIFEYFDSFLVGLVRALDEKHAKADGFAAGEQALYGSGEIVPPSEPEIRASAAKTLQDIVGGMNEDNFIVRQHRRSVEKFREPSAWGKIDDEKRKELVDEVAPLPSSHMLGTEDAKRFDLLMFQLELALLKGSKRFDTLRKQLLEIASALEEQTAIPAIAQHAELIEDIQTDQWWEGVTVPLLELVRLRLRNVVQHIEKGKKALVYSNFADEIGEGVELQLPQVGEADFARFKTKARHFLRAHQDNIVLHKLRQGKPLTPSDLGELEKMLLDAGVGEAGDIERARETSHGFGRFVRSLVGLDRATVSQAFGGFIAGGTASAAQIEFINMVIEHLTDQGMMDPSLLYEPPFTGIAPTGPEHLFDEAKVVRLVSTIREINDSAVA